MAAVGSLQFVDVRVTMRAKLIINSADVDLTPYMTFLGLLKVVLVKAPSVPEIEVEGVLNNMGVSSLHHSVRSQRTQMFLRMFFVFCSLFHC